MVPPRVEVSVSSPLESVTSGIMDRGMLNSSSSRSSHWPVRMLNNIVREAFETSVLWVRPPVSFQSSQVSIVPKASRPAFALAFAPLVCLSSQLIFVALK